MEFACAVLLVTSTSTSVGSSVVRFKTAARGAFWEKTTDGPDTAAGGSESAPPSPPPEKTFSPSSHPAATKQASSRNEKKKARSVRQCLQYNPCCFRKFIEASDPRKLSNRCIAVDYYYNNYNRDSICTCNPVRQYDRFEARSQRFLFRLIEF